MRSVHILLLSSLVLLGSLPLAAQTTTISPQVLYPGENVLTINSPAGIRSVRVRMIDSNSLRQIEFRKIGIVGGCPTTYDIEATLNAANAIIGADIFVERCDGSTDMVHTQINTAWTLDENFFPDAEVGEEVCTVFRVSQSGLGIGGVDLDSITVNDPHISLRYSFPPPVRIVSGDVYRYNVCFRADKPGEYRFPVITWIRRDFPSGGYTTYPVADTGVVRVVPKRESVVLRNDPIDTIGTDNPPPVTDPTTFRTIAVPNAVRPKRGKFFVGSYDVIGLTVGYGVADQLLLFAGGTPPTPDDWGGVNGTMWGAWAVGAKLGTTLFDKLDLAGGFVIGGSFLDKEETPGEIDSRISIRSPYAAISYGTDDSRVSVVGGYASKSHETWFPNHPTFGPWREYYDTNAFYISTGGDYRFARHWKVAAEGVYMQTVDVVPLIGSVRYFTNRFAFDFGLAFVGITVDGAEPPPIPVVPVLSGVFVF